MDWNDFKDYARTPDGTKDIKEVSRNRKGFHQSQYSKAVAHVFVRRSRESASDSWRFVLLGLSDDPLSVDTGDVTVDNSWI